MCFRNVKQKGLDTVPRWTWSSTTRASWSMELARRSAMRTFQRYYSFLWGSCPIKVPGVRAYLYGILCEIDTAGESNSFGRTQVAKTDRAPRFAWLDEWVSGGRNFNDGANDPRDDIMPAPRSICPITEFVASMFFFFFTTRSTFLRRKRDRSLTRTERGVKWVSSKLIFVFA